MRHVPLLSKIKINCPRTHLGRDESRLYKDLRYARRGAIHCALATADIRGSEQTPLHASLSVAQNALFYFVYRLDCLSEQSVLDSGA
jgi:hypothetical protein